MMKTRFLGHLNIRISYIILPAIKGKNEFLDYLEERGMVC